MGGLTGARPTEADAAEAPEARQAEQAEQADVREVEEYLIREVLGWSLVPELEGEEPTPCACWSSARRCFTVRRDHDARPRPFRPARCLRDVWEVQAALGGCCRPYVTRPLWDGNVRVVVDCGDAEVVAEARSLARGLSLAIYGARQQGLL